MAKLYQPAIARSKDTRLCQANAPRPAPRSPSTRAAQSVDIGQACPHGLLASAPAVTDLLRHGQDNQGVFRERGFTRLAIHPIANGQFLHDPRCRVTTKTGVVALRPQHD